MNIEDDEKFLCDYEAEWRHQLERSNAGKTFDWTKLDAFRVQYPEVFVRRTAEFLRQKQAAGVTVENVSAVLRISKQNRALTLENVLQHPEVVAERKRLQTFREHLSIMAMLHLDPVLHENTMSAYENCDMRTHK